MDVGALREAALAAAGGEEGEAELVD